VTSDRAARSGQFTFLEPLALALLLLAVATQWGRMLDWRAGLGRFQALGLHGFAAYAHAVARRHRWASLPRAGAFVVLVALALRMAVLPVTPTLSDDVYRYAWEGKVLAHGQDPWRHAPASPELAPLRDTVVHPFVNHPELSAIYPPLAELGFMLVARISYTLLAFKLWVLLHDLALCLVLAWWCVRRGGSAWDALVYAWNPLVVSEYAGGAHHDPTGILWLVLALAWAERSQVRSAFAALAAIMVKLVTLPAWPFLMRAWSKRVRVLATLALAACLAGYVALTRGPDSGLTAFASRWRHNDALFGPLAWALGDERARLAVGGLLALLVGLLWWKRFEATAATRLVLRAGLLLGPVVHPWYLGWVLALEPIAPSWPWLLLSCTVGVAYGFGAPPVEGAAFHPSPMLRLVEYGLPVLLAIGLTTWGRIRGVRETA
jgi:hypothetical protein